MFARRSLRFRWGHQVVCPTDVCQEEALIKPDIGVEDIGVEDIGVRVRKWTHLVF
jgi:hypothetical protein